MKTNLRFPFIKYLSSILLLLYASVVIFGIYHHEPWRDEAHVWVQAREASLNQLVDIMRYEATPILWHLIVIPFAKLGFPYETMQVVHVVLAVCAVGVLLYFGKLPLLTKLLFIFSYYMAYEYAVIARNYVLTVLLLFVIATVYTKRFQKPVFYAILVSLLFHTNFHSIGIAVALATMYGFELMQKRLMSGNRLIGLAIMIGTVILTVYMFTGGRFSEHNLFPSRNSLNHLFNVMRSFVIPYIPNFRPTPFPFVSTDRIIVFLSCAVLVMLFIALLGNASIFVMAVFSFGWLFYIITVVFFGSLRHHGLILIYILFFLWITHERDGMSTWYTISARKLCLSLLSILLLFSGFYSVYIFHQEYLYPFSGSRDMALYIQNNGLSKTPIVTYPTALDESVFPYLPNTPFWFSEYESQEYRDFADSRAQDVVLRVPIELAIARLNEAFPQNAPVLFLVSHPFSSPLPESYLREFTLLHASEAPYFWGSVTESLWLYSRKTRQDVR